MKTILLCNTPPYAVKNLLRVRKMVHGKKKLPHQWLWLDWIRFLIKTSFEPFGSTPKGNGASKQGVCWEP